MTPAARAAAAIEILDDIRAGQPAEARLIRWAIVVSWTRKALAISATVSPPSMRSPPPSRVSTGGAS